MYAVTLLQMRIVLVGVKRIQRWSERRERGRIFWSDCGRRGGVAAELEKLSADERQRSDAPSGRTSNGPNKKSSREPTTVPTRCDPLVRPYHISLKRSICRASLS